MRRKMGNKVDIKRRENGTTAADRERDEDAIKRDEMSAFQASRHHH